MLMLEVVYGLSLGTCTINVIYNNQRDGNILRLRQHNGLNPVNGRSISCHYLIAYHFEVNFNVFDLFSLFFVYIRRFIITINLINLI